MKDHSNYYFNGIKDSRYLKAIDGHISSILEPIMQKIEQTENQRLLKAIELNKPEWLVETQYDLFS